ncbi:MAG TPA: hypothetical protein VGM56_12545 [Byssovorax sp.]|jgi:hypothetical protein
MIFGALGLFILVVLVAKLARRRAAKAVVVAQSDAIDDLVARCVARGVAKRAPSLDAEQVEAAITGTPEPEVVARVEELVKSVELSFERVLAGGPLSERRSWKREPAAMDVRVTVRFDDGAVVAETRRVERASLPPSIRADLDRTGAARAFRAWQFPWAR